MSYRPDESTWMAYLYGELDEKEKEKMEQFLSENPDAQKELQQWMSLRKMMNTIPDKEVIAPPLFLGDTQHNGFWSSPYFKTILSIAASLIIVILVGRFSGLHIGYVGQELRIGFGEPRQIQNVQPTTPSLTTAEVQDMINNSLTQNNAVMQASMKESQQKLDASIKKNLLANSTRVDKLVRQAATASDEQIQQYVASLQNENMKLVKDYFQLTSSEQKKYIEDMLVDFAKYLQQQQSNDLQVVQTRLNSLEKNTNMFKQETEQILSSIITNGNSPSTLRGTRN
jgi:hypothetical protein